MGGERVTERMRREVLGQTGLAAGLFAYQLGSVRRQGTIRVGAGKEPEGRAFLKPVQAESIQERC